MRVMRASALLAVCTALLVTSGAVAREPRPTSATIAGLPVVKVPAGVFEPLYRTTSDQAGERVRTFWLMTRPVTNGELLDFVRAHPEYRRGAIARVFAEPEYLSHWHGELELGAGVRAAQPVTHVSWFVARAFCEARGMRLPLEAEWELAAAASRTQRDGARDPALRKAQLDWYAAPRSELPDVPHGPANVYGVHDLHGVIWEWVEDFNNAVALGDTRDSSAAANDRFCGGGALSARDAEDYAGFMRVAMRSSLQAPYTSALLGFRCAADLAQPKGSAP